MFRNLSSIIGETKYYLLGSSPLDSSLLGLEFQRKSEEANILQDKEYL
jgi:hypothetical protein